MPSSCREFVPNKHLSAAMLTSAIYTLNGGLFFVYLTDCVQSILRFWLEYHSSLWYLDINTKSISFATSKQPQATDEIKQRLSKDSRIHNPIIFCYIFVYI